MMHRRRGSNAVEFALVLPFLVGVMALVVDWGLYFQSRRAVLDSVRDGVRAGVAAPFDSVEDVALEHTTLILQASGLSCDHGGCKIETAVVDDLDLLVLEMDLIVPYTPVFGLFPTPQTYRVRFAMAIEDEPEPE